MLPSVSDHLKAHGLWAKKAFGQHFLLDGNLLAKITRTAGELSGKTVVEVGPGPGGLTRAILDADAERLIVIEKDRDCLPLLEEIRQQSGQRMEIIHADATKVDWQALCPMPYLVMSNLPYNVSTLLFAGWMPHLGKVEKLVLMFQKEVAERLVAAPDTEAYGRLSLLAQHHCQIHKAFDVPASAFTPPPKVMSSIVVATPRPDRGCVDAKAFERITAAAFGQRRKMLRSSLKSISADVEAWCDRAGINPTARAETLSLENFRRLVRYAPLSPVERESEKP